VSLREIADLRERGLRQPADSPEDSLAQLGMVTTGIVIVNTVFRRLAESEALRSQGIKPQQHAQLRCAPAPFTDSSRAMPSGFLSHESSYRRRDARSPQ